MTLSLELLDGQIVLISVVLDQVHSVGRIETAVGGGTGQQITAGQRILILINLLYVE